MKKLLTMLMLLGVTLGAAATHWENTHENLRQGSTVIYANFTSNLTGDWREAYVTYWELAAFIDGECRWTSNAWKETEEGDKYYQIEVPGNYDNNDDAGKEITFKVYNTYDGTEYDLHPSETLTFGREKTYGVPSGPRITLALNAVNPASVAIQNFQVEVGQTVTLKDYLTYEPEDADLPLNITWTIGGNNPNCATIDNEAGTLTGVRVGLNIPLTYQAGDKSNSTYRKSGTFDVIQHATAINILQDEYTIYMNTQPRELAMIMRNMSQNPAYQLDPRSSTDVVEWEIDPEYIGVDAEGMATPIKATHNDYTEICPFITKTDGTKLYPADGKKIKIYIKVAVESMTFNWPNEDITFKANVGDDIYNRLASFVSFEPTDATDQTFSINPYSDNTEDYLTIGDASVKAIAKGATLIQIQPNDPNASDSFAAVPVEIFDPLKSVVITEPTLTFDSSDDLNDMVIPMITDNIVIPDGRNDDVQEGTITIAGVALEAEGGVTMDGVRIYEVTSESLTKGTSTVTVVMSWNTYDNYDGTDESIEPAEGQPQTFQIVVTTMLQNLTFEIAYNESDPTSGTITLIPEPEDADIDGVTFSLHYEAWSYGDCDWEDLLNIEEVADGNGLVFAFKADLPGDYYVTAFDNKGNQYYGSEAGNLLNIPTKVSLATGWQWKSNNWCDATTMPETDEGGIETSALWNLFGGTTDLIEARTQFTLLYNDPKWGYYGSMLDGNAIMQNQMFKANMKNARESYLYFGYPAEDLGVNLEAGWNWVGSPYFYDRLVENALHDNSDLPDGMVIISKDGGSIEYDAAEGKWQGDLTTIKHGEGYVIYNPTVEPITLSLSNEIHGMLKGNDVAPARAARQSVWSYDHSRFASNMTMVAVMPQLGDADHYSIGAFVDGECRGEGRFINGRAYITVHTDGGEQVSLQLYDTMTGEFFDIDQTFRSQTRMGSVKAPVQLSSNAVVTGVKNIENGKLNIESYDLGGRHVNNSQSSILNSQLKKGLTIQRRSDGSVKKVVK
ncbi:MAG: hypothetical protein IJV45_10810 [Prevotella sp.]|nr:hypothetical protein [Prevotella sp.]